MKNQPTVAFHTLGCKLNFAESSAIGRQLMQDGFRKISFDEPADVYVINTCSVTENADRECRKIVQKAMLHNPAAFVAVIGCYAQLKPEEIAAIEGVDLVLGATEKFKLSDHLATFTKKEKAEIHSCEINEADFFVSSYSAGNRTRSFLKVQDGCDYSCSYCTIPLARGASRSDSIENIRRQALEIATTGAREIVLTGVNIGDFGANRTDSHEPADFLQLIRTLDAIPAGGPEDCFRIDRIRISSIEPNLLTDEIIEFVASSEKFVPHFHIPLQSGSNKILKLMRRRYLRELYASRVATIKSAMPDCCIGADVITGFPGETESDFLESYQFINELDISYLHVFTYSERDHTDALEIAEVVPVAERKRRNKMLRILSEKKQRRFYESHAGKIFPVLFEADRKKGLMHGFTPNYIKVNTPYDETLVNRMMDVRLTTIGDDASVSCELLQEQELHAEGYSS